MKIIFIGDSITAAGKNTDPERSNRPSFQMGAGCYKSRA